MSDKKDELDEAGWSNAKMAQSQMAGDSWKELQKIASQTPEKPGQKWKKDQEQEFELDPAAKSGEDLKLANEMGTGGVAGYQAPLSDEDRMVAVRELIKNKVKEVVRKKAGGGGFALYAPNKGKKGKPKAVGNFPTKLGAKRAELSRYPPKEPGKLGRLRKEVDKLVKNPKKAAEKEKAAQKQKGTDKGSKKEGVNEAPTGTTPFSSTASKPSPASPSSAPGQTIHKDMRSFMAGLKAIPSTDPSKRGSYVQAHINNADFQKALQTQEPDANKRKAAMDALYKIANNAAKPGGQNKLSVGGVQAQASENTIRRHQFMERVVLSKIITRSLTESLFREEKTESEWDDYISKLSKNALAGDSKFQQLQKNISKKTEGILDDSFNSIRKAVGKEVKLKSFGIKHDPNSGQTYLAFGASFEDVTAEPIYIHIEGGVPKIDLSTNAKVALTKADPSAGKMFRAELVTVQERVLDNMDDLAKAIQTRDKYLQKMENEVDGYVAGLSPLQVSLLKQLLVKKYRKIT